jgi:hypothetical protein
MVTEVRGGFYLFKIRPPQEFQLFILKLNLVLEQQFGDCKYSAQTGILLRMCLSLIFFELIILYKITAPSLISSLK